MDQPAFAEGERWCFHEDRSNRVGELLELGLWFQQRLQPGRPRRNCVGESSRELWNPFEPIGDGHQITGTGMAGAGPAREPFQIPHGSKQPS